MTLEIQRLLGQPVDDGELKALFEVYKDSDGWAKVRKRYFTILQEESTFALKMHNQTTIRLPVKGVDILLGVSLQNY